MIEMTRKRQTAGWSRTELGRRARVHPARVGAIENGRVVPYDIELRRIAKSLGWTGELRRLLKTIDGGNAEA